MAVRDYAQTLWDEAEHQYQSAILSAVPPLGGRLLDVGCDDGTWTERIREMAGIGPAAVAGIEIVPERRALAQARGFTVEAADLEQRWPFPDGTFELVHANQVIEHVKRLDHFVTEMRRVLTPGGWAIVCTENLASWHNIGALVLGLMPFSLTNISTTGPVGNRFALHAGSPPSVGESWQHIHVVTLPALEALFGAHGLEVDRTFAAGYHPLRGRLARAMADHDPRHSHFIGLRARKS